MDYRQKALQVIAKVSGVPPERLQPEMELVANLGMDSAKALEVLVELEDQLDIEIDDDAAARLNSVGDILTYLDRVCATPA